MNRGANVVVLGAGVGGIVTARRLRKELPKQDRVIVVERNPEHVFSPSLIWLMVNKRHAEQVHRPTGDLLPRGVELMVGDVDGIDTDARVVTVAGTALPFSYLVIALGAELLPDQVPGLSNAGHNFYTLEGATAFARALKGFRGGRIVVLTASPAYKCPAAPYEAAMLIDAACREMGIRDRTEIEIHAAEPAPMPVAGPEVGAGVRQLLEQRGISYFPAHQIESVSPEGELAFTDGARLRADLLAYVPHHQATAAVRESGLVVASGWIAVDPATMATAVSGIYALGDVVSIPLEMGRPLPKAGVFAHAQGEVVARNIAAAIRHETSVARFDGNGSCLIEAGSGKAAFGGGDFYARPVPHVELRPPARRWHLAKLILERRWLRRWPFSLVGPYGPT